MRWCGSMAEQLICNQQVGGSTPFTSSMVPVHSGMFLGEFPSGQRGQTVNLLSLTSVVRIHLPPPKTDRYRKMPVGFYLFSSFFTLALPLSVCSPQCRHPSLHFALCSALHMPCLLGMSTFFRVSDGCFLPFDIGMQGARHRGYRGQNHRLEACGIKKFPMIVQKLLKSENLCAIIEAKNGRKGFERPTEAHGCHRRSTPAPTVQKHSCYSCLRAAFQKPIS